MEIPAEDSGKESINNEEDIKTDTSFNPEKRVAEEVVVEKLARNVWMIEKLKKINGLKNYKRIAAAAALALQKCTRKLAKD
ncbi:MAG: hypothetical protein JNN15_20225 [Blastocatellia bacterium]|nr:hypothetical protein [Blastocatellia bacterium]